MNFVDEIKRSYRTGGMHIQLIMVNAVIFLAIGITETFARLIDPTALLAVKAYSTLLFGLPTGLFDFLTHPWGLFTSILAHFGFWHFAMNMLFLYFSGQMFLGFFSGKRLLYTYLAGGIMGGLFEILAAAIFPVYANQSIVVVGASGSIMALFIALAFHRPQLQVSLFGILPIRLIFLALLFLVSDILNLGNADGTAHFAHLGGAILGILSIRQLNTKNNIINRCIVIGDHVVSFFKRIFIKKNMTVVQNKVRKQTDEEYNYEIKKKQEKIDAILDKISRSGYDSLTKEEKELLFKQSQR